MAFPDDDLPPDFNDDPLFDGLPGDRNARQGGFVPEFVKKVAVAGLGALFMTEEGIRSLAGQLKLPKELLGFIVSQAEKTKDEVGRVMSEEIRRWGGGGARRRLGSKNGDSVASPRLIAPILHGAPHAVKLW